MEKYSLSILIPARNEEWLNETVKNILENKRGKTEIIVGLDGVWPEVGLDDHPDVRIFYSPEVLGQRGMGNKLASLSRAEYVAKTDAHCAFDEGFDVKLMEAMKDHDDWTIMPAMKNLHAFSWVCSNCESEYYQGEKPDKCPDETCQFIDTELAKKVYFKPRGEMGSPKRGGPTSTGFRFTPDNLQFKYFNVLKSYFKGEVTESMSVQGSFFMLTRERYHTLNINDESWGGWGQQGSEVALKTWLSGGSVMCHRGTWYAHMFRTNDQVAFPWNKGLKEGRGTQQQRARKTCSEIFKANAWDQQVRGLSWLVERFWEPLKLEPCNTDKDDRKWTKRDLEKLKLTEWRFSKPEGMTKGILYFTDNELPLKIAKPVQARIRRIALNKGLELVSSSRKPMDKMGKNVVTKEPRGYLCMFKQILKGLEAMSADIVFMAEHDVLYPPEHFDFTPTDRQIFYYDTNWYKVHQDGVVVRWTADQVSGLCAYRDILIEYYKHRIETFDKASFDRKFEPFSGEKSEQWQSPVPYVDIRHGKNLTLNKRELKHFRKKETAVNFETTNIDDIPGWDKKDLSFIS